jgi:hypothetical protein
MRRRSLENYIALTEAFGVIDAYDTFRLAWEEGAMNHGAR